MANKQDTMAREYLREIAVSKQGMATVTLLGKIEAQGLVAKDLKHLVRKGKRHYAGIRFYDVKLHASVGYDRNCYDIVNAEIFGNHGTYIGLTDEDKAFLSAVNESIYEDNKLENADKKNDIVYTRDINEQKESKKIHRIARQNKKRSNKALVKKLELYASGYKIAPEVAISRMTLSISERAFLKGIYGLK
jgi:hypothetical protein